LALMPVANVKHAQPIFRGEDERTTTWLQNPSGARVPTKLAFRPPRNIGTASLVGIRAAHLAQSSTKPSSSRPSPLPPSSRNRAIPAPAEVNLVRMPGIGEPMVVLASVPAPPNALGDGTRRAFRRANPLGGPMKVLLLVAPYPGPSSKRRGQIREPTRISKLSAAAR